MRLRRSAAALWLASAVSLAPACGGGDPSPAGCTSDASCQDGDLCNGAERCEAGQCVAGTAVSCDDGIACTMDSCTAATGTCAHTPQDALCSDGAACNGVETCSAGVGCVAGVPIACDDGIACTVDTCDEPGTCNHAPQDALCSDGAACNGVETCSAGVGCVAGVPIACDDGIACTVDTCDEASGGCSHAPLHVLCSDGVLCNGVETCSAGVGCVAGVPIACDDGIACTTDICDAALDACTSIPDDGLCPCGQTCDAAGGCGNYCQVQTCQGKVLACGDCLDNDGDCRVDERDDQCLGACDNTEDSLHAGLPGVVGPACRVDCYFDGDSGSGNDDCYWDHRCDPLEVAPDFNPEGDVCSYDPATVVGSVLTCAEASAQQSATCSSTCDPVTPNGCDCFGCCAVPGAPTPVWLGSEDAGAGTCTLADAGNPALCRPCTQVPACLNTCEHCELCVGKTELPPDCTSQTCPVGTAPCGLPGQAACGTGLYCVSGCCQATPT